MVQQMVLHLALRGVREMKGVGLESLEGAEPLEGVLKSPCACNVLQPTGISRNPDTCLHSLLHFTTHIISSTYYLY